MSLDLDKHLRTLTKGELLPDTVLRKLCEKLKELLIQDPNVIPAKAPLTVVGNLHGQFYDLLETFRVGGAPPDTNYLFLGDFVSFGAFSVETASLLICLKLRFPDRITILRGRHESRRLSQVYGFYNEVLRKYHNSNVWNYFVEAFDYLPIAALVDNSIFCVHSGISSNAETIDHIRCLDRCQEIPTKGICYELLNANPVLEKKEGEKGKEEKTKESKEDKKDKDKDKDNDSQLSFGQEDFKKWITTNEISYMVRSNQLCIDGYQQIFGAKLATIWGAPNFMGRCGNVATIFEIADNLDKNFNTFHAAPSYERLDVPLVATKPVPDYFI